MNQLSEIVSNIDLATVTRVVLALVLSAGVLVYLWFVNRQKKGPRR